MFATVRKIIFKTKFKSIAPRTQKTITTVPSRFIKINSKDLNYAEEEAKKMVNFLKKHLPNFVILGPAMANIPKINNIYNMQIIVKYKTLKEIYKEFDYLVNHYRNNNKISVQIDINPLRM